MPVYGFSLAWILPYKDRIYGIYISIQSVCEFYFRFTKQKCKRTIVNNTNSDFHKSKETGKNRREKERNAKLPTKICPFSTPKIDGETLITS